MITCTCSDTETHMTVSVTKTTSHSVAQTVRAGLLDRIGIVIIWGFSRLRVLSVFSSLVYALKVYAFERSRWKCSMK